MQIQDDPVVDGWMRKWRVKEQARKRVALFTEVLPKELTILDKAAQAFSKIKLNDRGLPW